MGDFAKGVDAPTLPVDPTLAARKEKAATDQANAVQIESQGDTASIMARYGTRLALAGSVAPTLAKF